MRFDGANTFLTVGARVATSTYSVAAVVKTTSAASGHGYAGNPSLTILGDQTNLVEAEFGITAGMLNFNYFTGAGWQALTGALSVNDGTARAVALSYDDGGTNVATLYENAIADGTVTQATQIGIGFTAVGGGYVDGTLGNAQDLFNGDIGELLVYNRSLTSAEIGQLQAYLGRWGL